MGGGSTGGGGTVRRVPPPRGIKKTRAEDQLQEKGPGLTLTMVDARKGRFLQGERFCERARFLVPSAENRCFATPVNE